MNTIFAIVTIFLALAAGQTVEGSSDGALEVTKERCSSPAGEIDGLTKNSSIMLAYLGDRFEYFQDGWKVYVRTSPCSGRFDWVTVAQQNPTGRGGSGVWQTADLILTGTPMRCVREGSRCTKAEADAEAVLVRAQPSFRGYCCKDYSVWQNAQTRKFTIVLGKFGNPGPGWVFEDGPMCCEEAEAMTGITNACGSGGTTQGGGSGGFGPMTNSSIEGKTLTYYQGTTPEKCQADCGANPQCKAFGLIKAGFYSPNDPAMCYLISEVKSLAPSPCCISGVKNIGSDTKQPAASGIDLSGSWAGNFTGSSGCVSRWDLTLRRSGTGEWQGSMTITQINCAVTQAGKKVSDPMPVKIVDLGNGKLQFGYTGYNYNATYSGGKILWDQISFGKK